MMKKSVLILIIITIILIFVLMFFSFIKKENVTLDIFKKPREVEATLNTADIEIDVKNARVPIFMYHNVTDDLSYIEFAQNAVSPNDLESQLKTIKDNNYESIFLSDIEHLHNYTKPVALTFDDGFEDFYKNAFPLLKKYNIKATLFVIVGYINCPLYCKLEQLKEMQSSGLVDIESHTRSHVNLANSTLDIQKDEILGSTRTLNEYLNRESNSVFCYPYGAYNLETINILKESYKYAVIMGDSIYEYNKNNNYTIPRITVYRNTNINQFKNYLSNSYVALS